MTVKELSARLNISANTVYKYIREQKINPFDNDACEEFIKNYTVPKNGRKLKYY